ncbi:hypothetical protein A9B99_20890 [Mangrovibacter phragmitis]|uniref:Uncharacterized protein n=1 Tax=Mangrovibacter phragmitis TaxID=1691903 RepID=A0A1B7L5H6_9ENTR|nr:hypothetical protein [Mangrovibacter phragmitis]OAT77664.1 hypothetical protein A9B99_20890 [Mangrovibacter phragmitis]
MATTTTQTHPLFTFPLSAITDFTGLASYCENIADALPETHDTTLKMALFGRLNTCLTVLQPTLLDPVPEHLVESLTVDTLPVTSPQLAPDCTALCRYAMALVQTLMQQGLPPETEQQLTGLLSELINYFAAEMKAPRWLRTEQGVVNIETAVSWQGCVLP